MPKLDYDKRDYDAKILSVSLMMSILCDKAKGIEIVDEKKDGTNYSMHVTFVTPNKTHGIKINPADARMVKMFGYDNYSFAVLVHTVLSIAEEQGLNTQDWENKIKQFYLDEELNNNEIADKIFIYFIEEMLPKLVYCIDDEKVKENLVAVDKQLNEKIKDEKLREQYKKVIYGRISAAMKPKILAEKYGEIEKQ